MTQEEKKEGPVYRRTNALFFFLVFAVPGTVVTAIDSPSQHADPMARTSAIIAAGLGGYLLVFLLLVFALPHLVQRSGRADLARQWQCAAVHASLGASMLTIVWTLPKILPGSLAARIVVALLVALAVFGAQLWLKRRYFDRLCSQLRGWSKG